MGADAAGAEVKLVRRRQPEPEPVNREADREEWADLLRRYRTRSSPEMQRELYHAEARKRQKARTAATPTPTKGTSQSRSVETPVAAAPQPQAENVSTPPAPFVRAVPSEHPAPVPAPKTSDEWAYEHFLAFETLCGNGDRIAERVEEARAYEPEEAPPEYVW